MQLLLGHHCRTCIICITCITCSVCIHLHMLLSSNHREIEAISIQDFCNVLKGVVLVSLFPIDVASRCSFLLVYLRLL